jgi:hypothetical protein
MCLSRQGRSDRSHFALPLIDLTGKQRRSPRSDYCATRQSEAGNSQVQPQAQQEAPPRPTPELGLNLGLGRRTPPRPTPGLGLNLGLRRWSPPRSTPGLSLNLSLGRWSPPRPTPGLGLNLDLVGIASSLDPSLGLRRSLRLTQPWARTDRATKDASLPYP